MCASALTSEESEIAQDSILRIAQGCLRSYQSTDQQRAGALLLLDRVGNQPAIDLACQRNQDITNIITSIRETSSVLVLDALTRRGELTVTLPNGKVLKVNPFQRSFWELASAHNWVSVSAPTSAGKSHIIREWMFAELRGDASTRLVYIAPTRALVEEVSDVFRTEFNDSVGVHTLPWDPEITSFEKQVFVLTQERLHLLYQRFPDFTPTVIFVDEAQKVSDGTRGILLTQVIDEAVRRAPSVRLIFASPLSANPEVLLDLATSRDGKASLVGETVTVNQNLIFVNQVRRKRRRYELSLAYNGKEKYVGEIELHLSPGSVGKRVPYIAAAIGRDSTGNLVYANGPAEAEKFARMIFDILGNQATIDSDSIQELIDFSKGVVHERFQLAEFAKRGIAFHYGDMPLVLKAKVEELFRLGVLRYLVCTSTLLEGVNLPCRNIFLRSPHKGRGKYMQMSDFWNLAGRAGRWGKEFQGNVFCIDTSDVKAWPAKPGKRVRSSIEPAVATALSDATRVVEYIKAGAHKSDSATSAELESIFNWLTGRLSPDGQLMELHGVSLPRADRERIIGALNQIKPQIQVRPELIRKHAGISPMSMQRLLDAILTNGRPEEYILVRPTSRDAFEQYKKALDFVAEYLGGSFKTDSRRWSLARLIVHWMRGVPLGVIIDNRAKHQRKQKREVSYPELIRKVMSDVEDIARFEAPKYLSCYADVVKQAAQELGHQMEEKDPVDIEMMLELGVPRLTDMSFISIGLSRAAARAIADFVRDPSFSSRQCIQWIESTDLEILELPPFAVREILALRQLLADRRRFPE
jgi:helicase-like:DEAD/DEAH box helicase-like